LTLEDAVFGERTGRRCVAVTVGLDEPVSRGQHRFGTGLEIHRGAQQYLLPLQKGVGTADLSFKMDAPTGFPDRVVAEVHQPTVRVVNVRGLRGRKHRQSQCDRDGQSGHGAFPLSAFPILLNGHSGGAS
jgi:hypothetical protein